MRALNGGEGGQIQLDKVILTEQGKLDFSSGMSATSSLTIADHSDWVGCNVDSCSSLMRQTRVSPINPAIPSTDEIPPLDSEVDRFSDNLSASILRRVENIPPIEG